MDGCQKHRNGLASFDCILTRTGCWLAAPQEAVSYLTLVISKYNLLAPARPFFRFPQSCLVEKMLHWVSRVAINRINQGNYGRNYFSTIGYCDL